MVVVPLPEGAEETGDVGLGDLAQAAQTRTGEVLGVPAQVAAVGGDRVGRQAAFDREMVEVPGDDAFDGRPAPGCGGRRLILGEAGQCSTSASGTTGMPWAWATSGSTIWPATTLTPCARARLLATAAAVPSLASAMT
ncbi:MAG: hypothetical protein JWP40_1408 [Blastococcus sp.]|nr:hypothetical protein [Blastococcus sp.]